jgi:hypothetical protein
VLFHLLVGAGLNSRVGIVSLRVCERRRRTQQQALGCCSYGADPTQAVTGRLHHHPVFTATQLQLRHCCCGVPAQALL